MLGQSHPFPASHATGHSDGPRAHVGNRVIGLPAGYAQGQLPGFHSRLRISAGTDLCSDSARRPACEGESNFGWIAPAPATTAVSAGTPSATS